MRERLTNRNRLFKIYLPQQGTSVVSRIFRDPSFYNRLISCNEKNFLSRIFFKKIH